MKTSVLSVVIAIVAFALFGISSVEGSSQCSQAFRQAGDDARQQGTFDLQFCEILRDYMRCLVNFHQSLGSEWDADDRRRFQATMERSMSLAGYDCNLNVDATTANPN